MQEGDVVRLRLDRCGRNGSGRRQIHRKPAKLRLLEAGVQIRAQGEGGAGEREHGLAIRKDGGAGVPGAVSARHHHRHRDHACDQAAEEGNEEFEARGKNQDGAIAGPRCLGKSRRERVCGVMQLTKGKRGFFLAAIGEENVGALAGLACGAPCEQCHKRAETVHAGQRRMAPGLSGRTRGALFGKVVR